MDKTVTGCADCPMFESDTSDRFDECRHPLGNFIITDGIVEADKKFIHCACPLKVESITIKLKDN